MTNPNQTSLVAETRNTASTRERVRKTIILIEEFRVRSMSQPEVSELLKFSTSGTRKYLRDLRDAGIIRQEIEDEEIALNTKYRITEDNALVDTVLQGLRAGSVVVVRAEPQSVRDGGVPTVTRTVGTTQHSLKGILVPSPVREKHVFRDPMVSALFGSGHARKVSDGTET